MNAAMLVAALQSTRLRAERILSSYPNALLADGDIEILALLAMRLEPENPLRFRPLRLCVGKSLRNHGDTRVVGLAATVIAHCGSPALDGRWGLGMREASKETRGEALILLASEGVIVRLREALGKALVGQSDVLSLSLMEAALSFSIDYPAARLDAAIVRRWRSALYRICTHRCARSVVSRTEDDLLRAFFRLVFPGDAPGTGRYDTLRRIVAAYARGGGEAELGEVLGRATMQISIEAGPRESHAGDLVGDESDPEPIPFDPIPHAADPRFFILREASTRLGLGPDVLKELYRRYLFDDPERRWCSCWSAAASYVGLDPGGGRPLPLEGDPSEHIAEHLRASELSEKEVLEYASVALILAPRCGGGLRSGLCDALARSIRRARDVRPVFAALAALSESYGGICPLEPMRGIAAILDTHGTEDGEEEFSALVGSCLKCTPWIDDRTSETAVHVLKIIGWKSASRRISDARAARRSMLSDADLAAAFERVRSRTVAAVGGARPSCKPSIARRHAALAIGALAATLAGDRREPGAEAAARDRRSSWETLLRSERVLGVPNGPALLAWIALALDPPASYPDRILVARSIEKLGLPWERAICPSSLVGYRRVAEVFHAEQPLRYQAYAAMVAETLRSPGGPERATVVPEASACMEDALRCPERISPYEAAVVRLDSVPSPPEPRARSALERLLAGRLVRPRAPPAAPAAPPAETQRSRRRRDARAAAAADPADPAARASEESEETGSADPGPEPIEASTRDACVGTDEDAGLERAAADELLLLRDENEALRTEVSFLHEDLGRANLRLRSAASGECSICMEPRLDPVVLIPCGHATFCGACLARWAKRSDRCPSCNERYASINALFC